MPTPGRTRLRSRRLGHQRRCSACGCCSSCPSSRWCSPPGGCCRDAGDPCGGSAWQPWRRASSRSGSCPASWTSRQTSRTRIGVHGDGSHRGQGRERRESGSRVTTAVLLTAVSLVLRFRRSTGTERQQLKWFAFAGLATVAGLMVATLGAVLPPHLGRPHRRRGVEQLHRRRHARHAGRHGDRGPAAPALRHRRGHQPHAGLRHVDRGPGNDVRRLGAPAEPGAEPAGRRLRPLRRRLDPGGGRTVPARPQPDPGGRRPTVLPQPVRRRAGPSTSSPSGCATSSTWTPSAPTCARPPTRPCSPPTSPSGSGHDHPSTQPPCSRGPSWHCGCSSRRSSSGSPSTNRSRTSGCSSSRWSGMPSSAPWWPHATRGTPSAGFSLPSHW